MQEVRARFRILRIHYPRLRIRSNFYDSNSQDWVLNLSLRRESGEQSETRKTWQSFNSLQFSNHINRLPAESAPGRGLREAHVIVTADDYRARLSPRTCLVRRINKSEIRIKYRIIDRVPLSKVVQMQSSRRGAIIGGQAACAHLSAERWRQQKGKLSALRELREQLQCGSPVIVESSKE